jgi:hydrogenase nickel incorporation protein HypA/HybF
MHELSIALDIIDFVQREVALRQLHGLSVVGVRVGAFSAVDPESLEFGFTAACRDTVMEGVKLVVEWVPAQIKCEACGHENTTDQPEFICPKCDSANVRIKRGYELEVAYLETADNPPT